MAAILHIDIETYSGADLVKVGMYKYAEDKEFEILMLAYAFDDCPVEEIDLMQEVCLPPFLESALLNPSVIKMAHNANFERVCLSAYLGKRMPPEQWVCTAVRAASMGLPRSLAEAGKALGLPEDKTKMAEGKRLITYFCKACKPTLPNKGRTRNLPEHAPEKWNTFKAYCGRDVEAERAVHKALLRYPQPPLWESDLWYLDQRINDKGVKIDTRLVNNVLDYFRVHKEELLEQSTLISGLANPNSLTTVKEWLKSRGVEAQSLDKEAVVKLIAEVEDTDIVEFLALRQELGKTSVAKYDAMARSVCSDNRLRGMLLFYGASRTGRWAGRIVQLQNLPQNSLYDLHIARECALEGDFDFLQIAYPSVTEVFSQLIRTAFVPKDNHVFLVADYSAIEARVISWLAGEKWRVEVFESHGKIYEASAALMFGVPIEAVTKGSDYRKKGKVAELACGFAGGVGALIRMGALDNGLKESELQPLIDNWRRTNSNIVSYWGALENAARNAILNPGAVVPCGIFLKLRMLRGTLFIKLPSGRYLAYYGAHVQKNGYRQEIRYQGPNPTTHRWEETSTYGGKLVENVVQAIARDCLGIAMLALQEEGYIPCMHVHDEVVLEIPTEEVGEHMARVKSIMSLKKIEWLKGLRLTADAFSTDYYIKD